MLILVETSGVEFSQFLAFVFKRIDKTFHFLFRPNQPFNFANPRRILLANVDGHFYGSHVALGHPVETVDIVEKASFDLFDGSCVEKFFLDHLETAG